MHKAANKQQKKVQPKKTTTRKIATKKVVKKQSAQKVATPTTAATTAQRNVTTTQQSAIARASASFVASMPKLSAPIQFQPLNLAQAASFKPNKNAAAFKQTRKLLDQTANAPSPAKVIFQAQKFIQQDVETLSKELSPTLADELQAKGFSYAVNDEGIITVLQKQLGYDIEFVFDREFEYAEQDDQEEEQQEEQQEGDEGKYAFHNVTITMSKAGRSLRLGGQMHLNGDLKVQTFTPYQKNGTELRTISTEDLSDGTVNAIFDALEVTCLSDETCSTILEVGRQERLKTHLQSVDFIAGFLGDAETM